MPRRKKTSLSFARPQKNFRGQLLRKGRTNVSNAQEQRIQIDIPKPKDTAWSLEQIRRELKTAKKTEMPEALKPMLASVAPEPFNDKDWQFEIKWDGYRALAFCKNEKTELRSRNELSYNRKFPSIVSALKRWPVRAVVDGEVVVLNESGRADFGAIQSWHRAPKGNLFYYVFDLLWIEGCDLRGEPLTVRRQILKKILPDEGPVRFSESIEECGKDFFAAAEANGLEGIIAKKKDALYEAGQRTSSWYKIKTEKRHEAAICGYTKKRGTDRLFSSLVLGLPEGGTMKYLGLAGTGYNRQSQQAILSLLKPLHSPESPFAEKVPAKEKIQWVKPQLVCEVKYTELTKGGLIRHPVFIGLRPDKNISDINIEESSHKKNNLEASQQKTKTTGWPHLNLSNLSKIYFPKEGYTKGDVLAYYEAMADYILPYMKDRPQSLNRHPDGIKGENFYQKNMKGKAEDWLTTFSRRSDSDGKDKNFLVCTGEESLLYMANLGCIEMNPWHSTVHRPLCPNWCVIDLDPGEISFEKVIETGLVVRDVCKSLHVPSYPKTSGSTGLHIYIPLGAQYGYEQSRQFAQLIASMVYGELPKFTSLLRNPAKRKDKIYLDYLQNRESQTICAPYSLRPKPGATASAPLHWEEVKKGLRTKDFTIKTLPGRVRENGDLFSGVLGEGVDLKKIFATIL